MNHLFGEYQPPLTVLAEAAGARHRRVVTQYGYVAIDVNADWGLQPLGWRIRIHGEAPFEVSMPFPVPPDDIGSLRDCLQRQRSRERHPLRLRGQARAPHHPRPAADRARGPRG